MFAACGPQPQVPRCNPVAIVETRRPLSVSIAGEAVTLDVRALPTQICTSGGPQAEDVVVEVFDAENRAVASTHTAPVTTTSGFATRVTFTPTTPGLFFVSARFEPTVASVQVTHLVATDRGADQPVARTTIPTPCDSVWWAGSTLACLSGTSLTLWRDGAQQGAAAFASFIDGDDGVVWWRTQLSLDRLQAVDGGSRHQAWLHNTPIQDFTCDATTCAERYLTTLRAVAEGSDGGLQIVASRNFSPQLPMNAIVRSGETFSFGTGTELCASEADGGLSCEAFRGEGFIADGEGLVFTTPVDEETRLLARWSPMSGVRTLTVPAELHLVSPRGPMWMFGTRPVTLDGETMQFEVWPPVFAPHGVSVTTSHLVVRQDDGVVVVYARRP